MKQDETELLDAKTDYLSRVRSFLKNRKSPGTGVPRMFRGLDPRDPRWTKNPQSILPIFQKIILSIPESQRLLVLDGLNALPHSKDPSEDRFYIQDEIFRGVTGYYYFKLLPPYLILPAGLKEKKFYWLIRSGILAYEKAPLEKRKKFNKAVMPNVKKQNVAVPYRLQQYVR